MEQYESIKSKERVKELGEVFTPDGIVKDMLGLVDEASIKDMGDNVPTGYKGYSYDLDKTFLEPSCGTGNFLVEIVRRKCETAVAKSKINGTEEVDIEALKINLLKAVATTYGVDIMSDNVGKSRERVIEIVQKTFEDTTNGKYPMPFKNAVAYIVEVNIIYGNTLENTMAIENNLKMLIKNKVTGKFPAYPLEGKLGDAGVGMLEYSEWRFTGENVKRTSYLAASMDTWYEEYDEVHYKRIKNADKVTNPDAINVRPR